MQMLSQQMSGMPKLMLKKQYIKNFNNDGATPIMDDNPNGWSAQYLQPGFQSSKGQELVDFLLTSSKTHAGSTETATGELAKSSQMNATAIMMLQKASAVPIDQIKRRFRRTIEEVGNIWIEFWTINYNTQRIINIKDSDGIEKPQAFRGSDFKDIGLKLRIEINASAEYSESLTLSTLDKFYDKGDIDIKMYAELAPESIIPFKEKLIDLLERREQNQVQSLTPEEQATLNGLPQQQRDIALKQLQPQ